MNAHRKASIEAYASALFSMEVKNREVSERKAFAIAMRDAVDKYIKKVDNA